MASGADHRIGAFVSIAVLSAREDARNGQKTVRPLVDGLAASLVASLPDWVEPASNPHHRQLFHSCFAVGVIGYGVYRAYHWRPDNEWEELMRWAALIAGGAYLVHLAMDATTSRSLPLLGRI